MTGLSHLIRRNSKLFFKDKGMFFTSLITPIILLVLYISFLGRVYRDAFMASFPGGFQLEETLINGMVGGQLLSSLLSVSCITVSFCSNMLMVQDKVSGARRDLTMSPVKSSTLALGYFISSWFVTVTICLVAMIAGMIYLYVNGWYLNFTDVLLILADIMISVFFGTALSSLINCNLSTNGQVSAVGTIVSSGYGFISGAYMPISNFSEGLQKVISFLPGTYATSLMRNHCLRGVFAEVSELGVPEAVIKEVRNAVDCNLYFFQKEVTQPYMYAIIIGATTLITLGYVALCRFRKEK